MSGHDGSDAAAPTDRPTKSTVQQILWVLAGVLGIAFWVLSLVAPIAPGFAMPLGVLAGAVAVVGLLPGQTVHGWLAVAVAVTAFTDAVTTTVTSVGAGWVPVTGDALLALQVVMAVSALLLQSRDSTVTQSTPDDDYAAYAEYVRAYQDYAQQYASYEYSQTHATGDAQGEASATAASAHDAWAAMQAKYARHVAPAAPSDRSARETTHGDAGDAGLPGHDRADRPHHVGGQVSAGSAPTVPGAH